MKLKTRHILTKGSAFRVQGLYLSELRILRHQRATFPSLQANLSGVASWLGEGGGVADEFGAGHPAIFVGVPGRSLNSFVGLTNSSMLKHTQIWLELFGSFEDDCLLNYQKFRFYRNCWQAQAPCRLGLRFRPRLPSVC